MACNIGRKKGVHSVEDATFEEWAHRTFSQLFNFAEFHFELFSLQQFFKRIFP